MESKHTTKYNFAKLSKKEFKNENAKPVFDPAILKAAKEKASATSNYSLGSLKMNSLKKIIKSSPSIFDYKKEESNEE
jgi:hypothetical protein